MNIRSKSFDRKSNNSVLIRSQPYISRYRIIPDWRKDYNLANVQPISCKQELFIVKRKQQIQKNRWKSIAKELTNIQVQIDKNYSEFKRRVNTKLSRSNQSKFLKYIGLGESQKLKKQHTHESFRKPEEYKRLILRTQPFWKKFLQK